jgi:hypothetical protein
MAAPPGVFGSETMKNTLVDLNNHLFAQLERLGDEDLEGDKLQDEIVRAKAVSDIATQIIANGALVLKAKSFMDGKINADTKLPQMLEGEKG